MLTAITIDNRKIEPEYNIIAFCGNCGNRVYAACVTPGNTYLKRPYFFHEHGVCCDDWYEQVSDWHREWQSHVPIEQREVSIDNGKNRHIADIYLSELKDPIVIELQKSNIPLDAKLKRDTFYGNVFWIVHHTIYNQYCFKNSVKPIFIDLCDGNIITPIKTVITKQEFIDLVLNNPDLKYGDWIFGSDGINIKTRFGIKHESDIIDDTLNGEPLHIIYINRKHGTFTTQCNPIKYKDPGLPITADLNYICSDGYHSCRGLSNNWKTSRIKHRSSTQTGPVEELLNIHDKTVFQCKYCGRLYYCYEVAHG